MSTTNRITKQSMKTPNWTSAETTLTREQLNKTRTDINGLITNTTNLSEDVVRSASREELLTAQRIALDCYTDKNIVTSDTNTLVAKNSIKAELYAREVGKSLLVYQSNSDLSGDVVYYADAPAGEYILYSTADVTVHVRTARKPFENVNREKTGDYMITHAAKLKANTPYTFTAPESIDAISVYGTGEDEVTMVRKEDWTGTAPTAGLSSDSKVNIFPYPFHYDHDQSKVEKYDPNKIFPIIDGVKFEDKGNGVLFVGAYSDTVTTTKAITFYLHYGTEVLYKPGIYTVGCKTFDQDSNAVKEPANTFRFIARWVDGDNNSYYEETINNNNIYSLKPVTWDAPVTFNAFNGINSISCSIHIPAGRTFTKGKGIYYIPTLVVGEEQLGGSGNPGTVNWQSYLETRRNIIYKYSGNLLRASSPRIYNNNINGTYIGNKSNGPNNGITVTSLGNGQFLVNGTATDDAVFQINHGASYIQPMGTLQFGNVPSDAPEGLTMTMRVQFSDNSWSTITAKPGTPGTFASTPSKYMKLYFNTRIHIAAGTVCDNVLVQWNLSVVDEETEGTPVFSRFEMPVAIAGYDPMFTYYELGNATYIGNPKTRLSAKVWAPKTGGTLPAAEEASF